MKLPHATYQKIRRPCGTIGQLEALAGLDPSEASRLAFWVRCDRIARKRFAVQYADPVQVIDIGRERCRRMIICRVKSGKLSMI